MEVVPRGPRRTVRLTPRTALLVIATLLGTLLARNVFTAAHRVIGWAVAAAIVAVLIKPIADGLARWIPRVLAIVLIALSIGGLTSVIVYGVIDDLRTETAALKTKGPEAAERLAERDDRIGRVARDLKLPERAVDAFEAVEDRFGVEDTEVLASTVGAAPAYFVSFILTMFWVLYGPGIVAGTLQQLPEGRRRRLERTLYDGLTRARKYVWVALASGVVVGGATYFTAEAWDLPAAMVLALVAGGAAMIPYIGFLIGAVPLVLLLAGLESVSAGAVALAVAALAQILEAFVLRPVVDQRTLHVGPAVPVIVGLIGLDVYGIGGAVFAIAAAVLVMGMLDAAARDDHEPLPTPSDDYVAV